MKKLEEFEVICQNCGGTGLGDLCENCGCGLEGEDCSRCPNFGVTNFCEKCKGTGKLDWLENIFGKRKCNYVKPGVYMREIDITKNISEFPGMYDLLDKEQ